MILLNLARRLGAVYVIDLPGMAEIWDALPEARMVGGAVRDMLAGRAVADVDFASAADARRGHGACQGGWFEGGADRVGPWHGDVGDARNGRFEVTTLRRDVQTDGRHAVVAFTDDWKMDASRRDFSINAMSATPDGREYSIILAGREDLAAGRVRFVGRAAARIEEDYLRILRFFRFLARYGRGAPDAEAVAAIQALRDGVIETFGRAGVERGEADFYGR